MVFHAILIQEYFSYETMASIMVGSKRAVPGGNKPTILLEDHRGNQHGLKINPQATRLVSDSWLIALHYQFIRLAD